MAKLLVFKRRIRLTIPEAYRVHRDIVEWDAQFSEDRIPDQALGLDPLTLKLMRWAMQRWERVVLNKYLAGTLLPRLQLDVLPALQCAAHFALVAERAPTDHRRLPRGRPSRPAAVASGVERRLTVAARDHPADLRRICARGDSIYGGRASPNGGGRTESATRGDPWRDRQASRFRRACRGPGSLLQRPDH